MTEERARHLMRKECDCTIHRGPHWLYTVEVWSRLMEAQAARINPRDPYAFLSVRALMQEDQARLGSLLAGMRYAGFADGESLSETLRLCDLRIPWRHRCAEIVRANATPVRVPTLDEVRDGVTP